MTFGIQTCGSHDSMTDEFTFSMCFGDAPALTFEGLTREQVVNMRDCLDAMLWHEADCEYEDVVDEMRITIGPYVSALTEEEAAEDAISMIRDLLLRKVEFSDDNLDGTLHWPDVERMLTRPLD